GVPRSGRDRHHVDAGRAHAHGRALDATIRNARAARGPRTPHRARGPRVELAAQGGVVRDGVSGAGTQGRPRAAPMDRSGGVAPRSAVLTSASEARGGFPPWISIATP